MSQILLLFDLDQCLPLTNDSLSSENFELLISRLRHVCLQLLLTHCSHDEPITSYIAGSKDKNIKNKILEKSYHYGHFSFRFYSSNEYFMVPDQLQPKFYEFGEESWDCLETALSERFERLIQDSKTNSFDPAGLRQHIEGQHHKPHAQTLRKALEEIAVLYNWDNPMLNSPIKKTRNSSRHRNPHYSAKDENIVYIFTCLPNNNSELAKFLGKTFRSNKRFNYKDISEEIFNQTNNLTSITQPSINKKSIIISNFKNPDHPIRLNLVDTASLFQPSRDQHAPSQESEVNMERAVKNSFDKAFRTFNGGVISFSCFSSDYADVKNICDVDELQKHLQYSVSMTSILKTYLQENKEQNRRASFDKHSKASECKLIFSKCGKDKGSDSAIEILLSWHPLYDGDLKHNSSDKHDTTVLQDNNKLLAGARLNIRACVDSNVIPRTQRWHQQYSLWPSSSNNTRKPAEGHFLFNCLAKKGQTLIVSLENDGISDKMADKTCIIHPLDGCSGILSVVDENDSSIYKKLDESYWCKPEKPIKNELSEEINIFIDQKIQASQQCILTKLPNNKFDSQCNYARKFNGNCFEPWKIPEYQPFLSVLSKMRIRSDQTTKKQTTRFRSLQKNCLPQNLHSLKDGQKTSSFVTKFLQNNEKKDRLLEQRLTQRSQLNKPNATLDRFVSNESGITVGSMASNDSNSLINSVGIQSYPNVGKGKKEQVRLSRAERLLNLGKTNVELRKNSKDEKITSLCGDKDSDIDSGDQLRMKKQQRIDLFEQELEITNNDASLDKKDNENHHLISTLQKIQVEQLQKGDDMGLACLAEVTIRYIANFLRNGQTLDKKNSCVEDILKEKFLLSPSDMQNSNFRKQIWGLVPDEAIRIRDHKLQVLYRVDLHWILSNQKAQQDIEREILQHLRQMALWSSNSEMVSFLNDVLTPNYIQRSPDLLTMLYEEQGQKRPKELELLFSPTKSDTTSVAPSSVVSHTSEMSYKSVPSFKAKNCINVSSGNPQAATKNIAKSDKNRTFKRYSSTQTLQINMVDKKSLGRSAQISAAGYNIAVNKSNRSGAKRNLSFDEPTIGKNFNTTKSIGLRRSPRKRVSTYEVARDSSDIDRREIRTPSKRTPRKTGLVTPCKMTPGKSHRVYASETPKNKGQNRRKTDGMHVVPDTPDIDQNKRIGREKTTPRRAAASLKLRKKTTFYSGNASRNLMKAEELINASQIQSFSYPNPQKNEDRNRSNLVKLNMSDEIKDKGEPNRRDSCGILFPHLVRSISQPINASQDGQNNVQIVSENRKKLDTGCEELQRAANNEIQSTVDLRQDSGCLSDLSAVESIPSRNLFSENVSTSAVIMVSPKASPKKEWRKVTLTPIALGKKRLFQDTNIHPAFAEGFEEFQSPQKNTVRVSSKENESDAINENVPPGEIPTVYGDTLTLNEKSTQLYEEQEVCDIDPIKCQENTNTVSNVSIQPTDKEKYISQLDSKFDDVEKDKIDRGIKYFNNDVSDQMSQKDTYINSSNMISENNAVKGGSNYKKRQKRRKRTLLFESSTSEHRLPKYQPKCDGFNINVEESSSALLNRGDSDDSKAVCENEIEFESKYSTNTDAVDTLKEALATKSIEYNDSNINCQKHIVNTVQLTTLALNADELNKCSNEHIKKTVIVSIPKLSKKQTVTAITSPSINTNMEIDENNEQKCSPKVTGRQHECSIRKRDIDGESIRQMSGYSQYTTPDKPSRKRKLTSRLGIDDITLNEAIHSCTPKGRLTPKYPRVIIPIKKTNNVDTKSPIMHVQSANEAPAISDTLAVSIPFAKRRRTSINLETKHEPKSSCAACRDMGYTCAYHDNMDTTSVTKSNSNADGHDKILYNNCDRISTESNPALQCGIGDVLAEQQEEVKSPGKFWSVASRTESPIGEIKLKFNRKKKPLVSFFFSLLMVI